MFLLINKPKGITSHDVIYKLRKITGIKKIGHAGTLDPNATGLLIVGVGRESTKQLGELTTKTKKTYIADIFLGEERDTDDAEGKTTMIYEVASPPSLETVNKTLTKFTGQQSQTPPSYSAIKIKGRKSYDLARKGKSFKLEPRTVMIYKNKLLSYDYPILKVEFEVGSGTYIRSLAKDIGSVLGTGGYLKELQRTKISSYSVGDAHKLEDLTPENWQSFAVNYEYY